MPQQALSVLRPAWTLSATDIDNIYLQTVTKVSRAWQEVVDDGDYIVRATRPSDLGETNEVWAETVTAAGNAYQDSQIATQQISDNIVVGLYGLVDLSEYQFVSSVRITAGAGRRAEWDLFPFLGTPSTDLRLRTGYADTPVIITQNINITVAYYVINFSPQAIRGVEIPILGVTAEKVGLTLQP